MGPHLCQLLQGTEVPGWRYQDSPPFLLGIQLYPQGQGSNADLVNGDALPR